MRRGDQTLPWLFLSGLKGYELSPVGGDQLSGVIVCVSSFRSLVSCVL